jgi:hypothetical protein
MSQKNFRVSRVASLLPPRDPSLPPPPLVECTEGKPGAGFNFREGGRMQVWREHYPTSILFHLTLFGSATLDGQPIRCSGFLPGVSLRVMVARFPSAEEINPDRYTRQVWQCVMPEMNKWLTDPSHIPGVTMRISKGGVTVRFARDELLELRPGVMQIEVQD